MRPRAARTADEAVRMSEAFDAGLQAGADLARRWVMLKARVLQMRREREDCEAASPATFGDDGEPPCWSVPENEMALSEWCGPCQRNQARYLYRQYTQKALWREQRKLLKAFLDEPERHYCRGPSWSCATCNPLRPGSGK